MKRNLKAIRLSAFGLAAAAAAVAAPLKVVTTTSDLGSIAKAVGGDLVEVKSITTGVEDPHTLQARPGFILTARNADLWICIGMELEIGWEPAVIDGSRNVRIRPRTPGHLNVSEAVRKLEVPDARVTRAMGDVHPEGNPHYWLDPHNVRLIARVMAKRFAELRPADAQAFERQGEAFCRRIDECMFGPARVAAEGGESLWKKLAEGSLDGPPGEGWLARMKPLLGKPVVTYHKSWVYFADRFGLKIAGELEPLPGIPPTAAHLAALEKRMTEEGVKVVLQEPYYSRKAADRVAERTGARVVVAPISVGGDPQADDYIRLMDLIVARLTAGS